MEERGPPDAGAGDPSDDPSGDAASETQLVPFGPMHRPNETYVIQIPKDQIYRVPSPENALIVEKHRNPQTNKKPHKTRCSLIVGIVIAVCLITAITLLTLYLALSPKDPTFSITQVHVKTPKTKSSSKSHPGYEISLKVHNPNGKMSVCYESGGASSLLYGQKSIGKGKFPALSQEGDESDIIKLELDGRTAALPSEVEKSMEGTSSKKQTPLSLILKLSDIPVKIKSGLIKSWDKDAEVECKFKVNKLGSDTPHTRVLQQECEAKLKD